MSAEDDRAIDRYVSGLMDPEEARALMQRVKTDPEFREYFVRYTLDDSLIRDALPGVAGRRIGRPPATARTSRISRGAWAAVAACLVIVAGSVWYNSRRSGMLPEAVARIALVRQTTPDVTIIRAKKTIAAVVGVKLLGGDRIETGKKATLTFGYENEDTTITVGDEKDAKGTKLTVGDGTKGKRLSLLEGHMNAKVAPQLERMPMEITTPHARARVMGTSFTLASDAARSELSVAAGSVRFSRLADGASIEVGPDRAAVVAPGVGLRARPARPEKCLESAGNRGAVGVMREGTSVIYPRGLTLSVVEGHATANAGSFQQDAIASFEGHQYAVFYNNARRVCVARRKLPEGPWKVAALEDYAVGGNLTYSAPALGICPADGTLHVVFDQSSSVLHRRTTKKGTLSRPDKVRWTASVFGPVRTDLPPNKGSRLTYARFFTTPSGRLQMIYRRGNPGDSDIELVEYNPSGGKWRVLGKVLSRAGAYGDSRQRGVFPNGIFYDGKGRLHVTWCWRETNDKSSNHDLCYAYSPDEGRTWLNSDGRQVGKAGSAPIRVDSPAVVAWPVAPGTGLMNSTAQAVDPEGRVHVITCQYLPEPPDVYVHYWRGADGVWHRTALPFRESRPKLVFDPACNAYMVFSAGRIASASAAAGWRDWTVVHREKDRFVGEPLIDRLRWEAEGVLTIMTQDKPPRKGTPTPMRTFDFRPRK